MEPPESLALDIIGCKSVASASPYATWFINSCIPSMETSTKEITLFIMPILGRHRWNKAISAHNFMLQLFPTMPLREALRKATGV